MYESPKPHVHIEQDAILAWMMEEKLIATLPEIAQRFDITEASARRKADGLVAQGKLIVDDGCRGPYGWLRRYGINLDAEPCGEAPRRLGAGTDDGNDEPPLNPQPTPPRSRQIRASPSADRAVSGG